MQPSQRALVLVLELALPSLWPLVLVLVLVLLLGSAGHLPDPVPHPSVRTYNGCGNVSLHSGRSGLGSGSLALGWLAKGGME